MQGSAVGRGADVPQRSVTRLHCWKRNASQTALCLQVNPRTYIGSGKVQEIMSAVANTGATTVVFDDELSPGEGSKILEFVRAGQVGAACATAHQP